MFFLLVAVSSTFLHFRKKKWSLKSRKCLKQLREGKKKHKTIVAKVQGFEKQTSWKVSVLDFVIHDKMSKKSDADIVHVHLNENVDVRHERVKRVRREITQHTTYKRGHGYSCRLPALVLNHFDIQSRRGYSCRVSEFLWKSSPHWHSELSEEVVSCQHHLRTIAKKTKRRVVHVRTAVCSEVVSWPSVTLSLPELQVLFST